MKVYNLFEEKGDGTKVFLDSFATHEAAIMCAIGAFSRPLVRIRMRQVNQDDTETIVFVGSQEGEYSIRSFELRE